MSSEAKQTPQDDNIVTRRRNIKESLDVIRDKKERLRTAMKTIKEQEKPDMDMMSKLLSAFDQMTVQEDQYILLLKSIVDIHEQATNDVAQEVEKLREGGEARKETTGQDKTEPMEATSDEMAEIHATLKEIEEVAQQAIQASILNEKLVEKLQLHKNKKATLSEIRKDKAAALLEKANEVLTDVEMTKLKVNTEKNERDKKKRELAELQKKALKKGIELGVVEDQQKDAVIRAVERVTDEVTRLPPMPTGPEEKKEPLSEETLEERRRQIRENIKKERERKEAVNETIRQKLKAMEARKLRMKQLRELLSAGKTDHPEGESNEASTPVTSKSLDSAEAEKSQMDLETTIRNATLNLQHLTAMRERLEDMQRNGEDITEDDAALIDKLDSNQESTVTVINTDNVTAPVERSEHEELEDAVRRQFDDVMSKKSSDDDQIDRIEALLVQQNRQMIELNGKLSRQVPSPSWLKARLTASPSRLLKVLARCILELADGQMNPNLDILLIQLFSTPIIEGGHELSETQRLDGDFRKIKETSTETEEHVRRILKTLKKDLETNGPATNGLITDVTGLRLRELSVHCARQICPSVAAQSINDQMGSLVEETVAQYADNTIAQCSARLLTELSDVLYQEITFFQLINSLNAIPDPETVQ